MMTHARFDTLLGVADALDERRRRLMVSTLMAAVLCMGAGTLAWVGDKLGIAAVTPPKNAYAVTFEVLTPPPPPPPPKGVASTSTDDQPRVVERPEVRPPEPEPALLEPILSTRPAKPSGPTGPGPTSTGDKGPIGVPWGEVGGDPRSKCLPPCLGTTPAIDRPPVPTPRPSEAPVKAPIKAVMAKAIYTPDPDAKALSRTPTGLTSRRPGTTTVEFCIDGDGRTYEVRTRSRFSGDPEVDRICRQTVKKWRFHPQRVAGKARSTCSAVVFDIRFD